PATSARPSTARSSIGCPRPAARTTSRSSSCASRRRAEIRTSTQGSAMTAYDVIVVGAGSACAVVARGLSVDPNTSVRLLAAVLRVEDDVDYGGDGLHGKGGPLPLSRPAFDELPPLDRALRTALSDRGYPVCDDYHALDATGVSRGALTLRDGRRVSTNDAYLEPARQRANLDVRGEVLVDRVLFDGRRATGVRTAAGEEIAGREVIVSAGA